MTDDLLAFRAARTQPDVAPVLAVLGGIVQEVDHHLLQPRRVGVDPEVAPVDRQIECMTALRR